MKRKKYQERKARAWIVPINKRSVKSQGILNFLMSVNHHSMHNVPNPFSARRVNSLLINGKMSVSADW